MCKFSPKICFFFFQVILPVKTSMGIRTHQNSRNVGTVSPQLKLPPKQCSPYLTFSHETFFHLKYFCSPCYHFFPSKKCVGFPYNHSRNKGKKISFHLLLKKNTQKKKKTIPLCKLSRLSWVPPPGRRFPKMRIEGIFSPGIGTCTLNPSNMEPMLLISLKQMTNTAIVSTSFP